MPSAGRARAARKSIMMLTFCVRRSPGDSAAATGWSGERRPMGPLAVSLPCPYRIVSVCRSAAAKNTRRSPTLCTRLSAQSRAERSAPTRIVRAWARAHARPTAVQVTHVCADGHAAALSAMGDARLRRHLAGCGGPSCSVLAMGTVSEAPSWGCLLAISGPYTERIFTVGFSGGLIGRSRKCAISLLHDCEVSHNHAVIELINGVLCIRDVGSTFGTYLNDKRLSEPKRASDAYKLKPCDSIKVGQTSLRWRPIGDIRRALMVCVPQPCGFPHDVLLRLPPATLSSDDQGHLLSTLTALYVQHMEVLPHPAPPQTHTAPACEGPAAPRNGASRPLTSPWQGFATLCRTATPVDLPQLERRLQQLDHVQRQTVRHATDSLQTVSVDAMANLGAAAAAVSGNPAQTFSLSEAAQGEGPRLVRLGELVREGLTLRAECWALMLEQHERLTQFIGA
eukprot:scaffold31088_cov75-Phaeocystis_antarctica.AAC.5